MILQRNLIILSGSQAESMFGPTWRDLESELEVLFDGHWVTAHPKEGSLELVAVDGSTDFERVYA